MRVIEPLGEVEYDEASGATVCRAALIECDEPDCIAQFFFVSAREFSTLCLEHAEDAQRAARAQRILADEEQG